MKTFQASIEHYGRKGMKWYQRIYGSKSGVGRKIRRVIKKQQTSAFDSSLNEKQREQRFIDMYKHRDKMSTKTINAITDRINAESRFKEAVYTAQNERNAKKKERMQKITKALIIYGAQQNLDKVIKSPDKDKLFKKLGIDETVSKDSRAYKEAERIYGIRKRDTKIIKDQLKHVQEFAKIYYNQGGGDNKKKSK